MERHAYCPTLIKGTMSSFQEKKQKNKQKNKQNNCVSNLLNCWLLSKLFPILVEYGQQGLDLLVDL